MDSTAYTWALAIQAQLADRYALSLEEVDSAPPAADFIFTDEHEQQRYRVTVQKLQA